MKQKFVFVILHYITIEDTKKCVESIINRFNDVNIVIVDNASPNNSGQKLLEMYKDFENIKVILNDCNLGFANGNNIGFKYAKYKLNADFIILCNNDTYILQDNFLKLILDEYSKSKFAILGPKILLPNNKINPVNAKEINIKMIKRDLLRMQIDYITSILYINDIYLSVRKILKNVLIKIKLKKNILNVPDPNKRYENIILHGCFLIFSTQYCNKFDGLDDRTFLYREEELLTLRLRKNRLKNVYNPQLEIFHKEYGATNVVTRGNRKKKIFRDKHLINSTKILISDLKNMG